MHKLYILLFLLTSIVYSECSFTRVDLNKATYQKECLENKTLSDKYCNDLQFYIKKCGVVVTTFDVEVKPSGKVIVDTKNVKVSNGSVDTKSKEENQTTVLKIYKYGSPHGIGNTFPSKESCEQSQAKLTKENAGLDYTYKCVKK